MKSPTQKTLVLSFILASALSVPVLAQMDQPKADPAPPAAANDSQNTIKGKVSAKTDDAITVNHQAIKVNSSTAISKGGTSVRLDDLNVGDKVAVTTTKNLAGRTQAVLIEVMPEEKG